MKEAAGIWIPESDEHFGPYLRKSQRIAGRGTYQLPTLLKALAHLDLTEGRDGRTAIDIGAHVGTWTRLLDAHFARVVAFEPLEVNRECWRRNMLHRQGTAELLPFALGRKGAPDVAYMQTTPGNSGMSWIAAEGEPVTMASLDTFRIPSVDLIKIDCEGYEYEAILGGLETIREWKPLLIVEQNPESVARYSDRPSSALSLLEVAGYEVRDRVGHDYIVMAAR